MPTYRIEDSLTGRILELEGDSPPTGQEMEELFAQYKTVQPASAPSVPHPTQPQVVLPRRVSEPSYVQEVPSEIPIQTPTKAESTIFAEPAEIKPLGKEIRPSAIPSAFGMGVTTAATGITRGIGTTLLSEPGVGREIAPENMPLYERGKQLAESGERLTASEDKVARDFYLKHENAKKFEAAGTQINKLADALQTEVSKETRASVEEAQNWLASKAAVDPRNVLKTANAVAIVTANQLPNTMIAASTTMAGVPQVGAAALIATEQGNWIEQAKEAGIDDPEILARWSMPYGVFSGAAEFWTSNVITAPFRGALKSRVVTEATGKLTKPLIGRLLAGTLKTLGAGSLEGAEELVQDYGSDAFMLFALDDAAKQHPEKAEQYAQVAQNLRDDLLSRKGLSEKARSFVVGMTAGLVMGGGARVAGTAVRGPVTETVKGPTIEEQLAEKRTAEVPSEFETRTKKLYGKERERQRQAEGIQRQQQNDLRKYSQILGEDLSVSDAQSRFESILDKMGIQTAQEFAQAEPSAQEQMSSTVNDKEFEFFTEATMRGMDRTQIEPMQAEPVAPVTTQQEPSGISDAEKTRQRVASQMAYYMQERGKTQSEATELANEVASAMDNETLQAVSLMGQRAETDVLTGLKNRSALREDQPLLYIDIDHFKSVNDTYGHPVGDQVLRELAAKLMANFNGLGIAIRLGGEELGVAPLTSTSKEDILRVAQQTLEEMKKETFADGKLTNVSFSAGFGENLEAADKAIYKAKNAGRNQIWTEGGRYVDYTQPGAESRRGIRTKSVVGERGAQVSEQTETTATTEPASGEIAYGQPLPEKATGNINLQRIINRGLDRISAGDEAYGVKHLLNEISERHAPQIEQAKRGTVTFDEMRQFASEHGMSEKQVLRRVKGESWNAERMYAARILEATALKRFRQLHEQLAGKGLGNITDNDIANLRLEMQRVAAIVAEVTGAKAEAARTLGSLRMMSQAASEKNYKRMFDALGGREINEKILKKIVEMDPSNERGMRNFIEMMSKASGWDMINEAWINMILSSPTTHLANIAGNAATTLYRTALEKPAAAFLSVPQRLAGKEASTYFGEVPAEVFGFVQGLGDAVRAAMKAWYTEMPSTSESKLETMKYRSIPSIQKKMFGKNIEIGGRQVRIPGRALLAADEFFKTIIRQADINAQAYKQAHREGLRGDKARERYASLRLNPTKEMLAHSIDESQYRTFNKPLGKYGNAVMSFRNKIPFLRYIIPFVRTPTNIAKFALERTPLGFAEKAYRLAKKEINVNEIGNELAKPLVGSMLAAFAAILASQGFITGAGPKDKDKRASLYRTGWMPYSFHVPGKGYFSFARLEPLGSLLGMAADFATLKESDDKLEEIASKIAMSFGRNITSKTFMKGLSDFMEASEDPVRYGGDYIQKMGGSLIPSFVASVARAGDTEMKQTETIRDEMQSRIPNLREQLFPKRDPWGRPIDRGGSFWMNFLSPLRWSAAKGDPVDNEIARLEMGISSPKNEIAISDAYRNAYKIEDESYKLTPEEYDRYTQESGKVARKIVERIMSAPSYNKLSDDAKRDEIESGIRKVRSKVREKWLLAYINKVRKK